MARTRAPRTDLAAIHRRIEERVDAWLEANDKTWTWLAKETGWAASMRRALHGPAADKPTSPTLGTLDRLVAVLGIGVDALVSPYKDQARRKR